MIYTKSTYAHISKHFFLCSDQISPRVRIRHYDKRLIILFRTVLFFNTYNIREHTWFLYQSSYVERVLIWKKVLVWDHQHAYRRQIKARIEDKISKYFRRLTGLWLTMCNHIINISYWVALRIFNLRDTSTRLSYRDLTQKNCVS